MTALYIIIAVVVLIILYVIATYNVLIRLQNSVKEAFSTMDVYLKKRWDLVPNLVETVKGYAKQEKDVFEDVTKLRSGSYSGMSDEEKIEASKKMSSALTKIMAVAENYPELKSNENFMQLQEQLNTLEDDIANSRKYYNAVAKEKNNKVDMFPSNIIAGMFNIKESPMFETDEAER